MAADVRNGPIRSLSNTNEFEGYGNELAEIFDATFFYSVS
jgi:hypothetical protein